MKMRQPLTPYGALIIYGVVFVPWLVGAGALVVGIIKLMMKLL